MKIACGIEYDGTDYIGFQRQRDDLGRTIQGELEAAVAHISGEKVVIHGAGRTDAGVHATGQVIHFITQEQHTPQIWQRALNATLPNAIAVRWAQESPERFHARFSAVSRSYRYTIWNDLAPSSLRARFSYYRSQKLDCELMQAACQLLLGRKDFGAFGRSPNATNPRRLGPHHCIRTLQEARCIRQEEEPALVYCDFTADAFLTGMVRRMVGTLLLVGQKRISVAEFQTIVQRADKTHIGASAPPHGLCLVRVEYPEQFGVMRK